MLLAATYRLGLLIHIIAVNLSITAARIQAVNPRAAPFDS